MINNDADVYVLENTLQVIEDRTDERYRETEINQPGIWRRWSQINGFGAP